MKNSRIKLILCGQNSERLKRRGIAGRQDGGFEKYAAGHRHFSFRGLLTAQSSKVEVIVTFLAILELMKMGTIRISQEHIFDDIQIDSKVAA